jgi:Icc protein
MTRLITENHNNDGVDRRGFLSCMAWAGTGVLYALTGGVARSQMMEHGGHGAAGLSFVQISDSHMGFNKEANTDVARSGRRWRRSTSWSTGRRF